MTPQDMTECALVAHIGWIPEGWTVTERIYRLVVEGLEERCRFALHGKSPGENSTDDIWFCCEVRDGVICREKDKTPKAPRFVDERRAREWVYGLT